MLNNIQKRLTVIAFFIGLNIVLGAYFLSIIRMGVPRPLAELMYRMGIAPNAATTIEQVSEPPVEEPSLNKLDLLMEINQYRDASSINPLQLNVQLTKAAEMLLELAAESDYDTDSNFESGALENALKESGYVYEWVSHNALAGPLNVRGVMTAWLSDESEAEALLNSEFTDVGIATDIVEDSHNGQIGIVIQLLGKQRAVQNQTTETNSQSTEPPPPREVPDNEVIQALNIYRDAHDLPPFAVNQNLCTYAEKRANDLKQNGGLDEHAGFKADFANSENLPVGIASYPRGRKIGENLAHQYCKSMSTGESFIAETGTALIEWCFDSSTKGHREAQLSTEFKNVCVRHADNMYVVIFGE